MSNPPSVSNVSSGASRHLSQVNRQENVQRVQSNQAQGVGGNQMLREVSSQLTQFLERVSKRSTVIVDLSDVKSHIGVNGKLNKIAGFAKIFAAAETVQTSMLRVNTLTGNQIADAFNPKKNDWKSGTVGDTIKAVSQALADLSEELLDLVNNPKVMEDPELHELLTDKYLQNCCRESEFTTVLMNVVNLKQGGTQALPGDVKLDLSQSLQSWMTKLAPNMHGTESTLAAKTTPALQELSAVLDSFKGDDRVVSAEERERFVSALQAAKAHIHTLATDATTVDKSFFREAEAILGKILQSMENLRETAINGIQDRLIKNCVDLPPCFDFSDDLIDALASEAGKCPNLAQVLRMRKAFSALAAEYLDLLKAQKPGEPKSEAFIECQKRVRDAARDLRQHISATKKLDSKFLTSELVRLQKLIAIQANPSEATEKALKKLPSLPEPLLNELLEKASPAEFKKNYERIELGSRTLRSHLNALTTFLERANAFSTEDVNTKQLLSTLFTQELPISSLVECRVNGIRDEDIDLSLCDDNIVSQKTFGAGGVNTVYEVTMNDGRVFIFKPESSSRGGLDALALAGGGYESDANIASLNIAAHRAADVLGLGDLIVSAHVGVCNGQLGFFMEKAPGVEAHALIGMQDPFEAWKTEAQKPVETPRFFKMSDAEFLKANGQLMKQCYDLEWADFILGSGDRHNKNYFVNISKNGSVGVKGIDNDMTFAKYRTGFAELTVSGLKKKALLLDCAKAITKSGGRQLTSQQVLEKLRSVDGITVNDADGTIKVDLSKLKQPWLRTIISDTFGMHQFVPPRVIDRGLYDRLLAFDNNPEKLAEYRNALLGRMGEENVNVAMDRLITAIQYAKELKAKNCVIENWESKAVQMDVFKRHEDLHKPAPETAFRETGLRHIQEVPTEHANNNMYFRDFGPLAYERLGRVK